MGYLLRQAGHMVLSSPDPEHAAQHLCDAVGVRITDRDGDAVYLSSNDRHHEVTYVKGAGQAVAIGLEAVSDAAIDEVAARVKADGLNIISDTPMGKGYARGVTFEAPGGAVLEVHSPIERTETRRYIGGGGPKPRRIEHFNFLSPDADALYEFVEDVLGMKLSDRLSDNGGRWYRAQDGFHHTLALLGADELRMHHYAFDHHSLYDLARLADNVYFNGSAMIYGPGRHGAGDNIFTYYLDPMGCVVENSVEMRHIDNDAAYEPGIWDVTDGLKARWINMWGTPLPQAFIDGGIPFAKV